MDLAGRLSAGIEELGLELPEQAESRLLDYLALLRKWNRVYNLTAIRYEHEMVVQHVLDSLVVLEHLPAATAIIDVGSGAGLPGIPLAIARPDAEVTLVEAVQKKSAFQQQAKIQLALANVNIFCGRVEHILNTDDHNHNIVISRAFAELAEFIRTAGHLVNQGGRLYAMKGIFPAAEIAAIPPGWQVAEKYPLLVPGQAAQRHLIVLEKQ
jgi:16S rRNA (guanine527-N7)-methyltransferase